MTKKELENKVAELRKEIQSLQGENEFLTKKADDSHLMGETAEKISSADNENDIISIVLKYVSSLSNVSYCSYLVLSDSQLKVVNEFAGNTDSPLKGKRLKFDGKSGELLTNEKCFIENPTGKEMPPFIPQMNCCTTPNSYYLFPLICRKKPVGWLLFINCIEGAPYLKSHLALLDRIGERVSSRIEELRFQTEITGLNEALEEHIKDKIHANRLLDCIYKVQSKFITFRETEIKFEDLLKEAFNDLLHNLIALTNSEYGFIGEILHGDDGTAYIKTWAITNIAWNEETRALYQKFAEKGMEFHNMDTLFGAVVKTGEHVISNSPPTDPRSGGLPEGHPPLNAFMGLPFYRDKELIGMIGVANCPGGYDENLAFSLQPFLSTCARIIDALHLENSRKQTEEALKKSKQRYELAQDAAQVGSWEWDIVTNELCWSDHIEPMLGFKKSEFKGTYEAFLETVHPEDRHLIIDAVQASIKEDKDYSIAHRVIRPDGRIRWVSERGKVFRNNKGEALRMLGVVQDITESKRTEEKLRARTNELTERVKEMDCLYRISKLLSEPNKSMDQVLEEILLLIPPSWQYPEITCAGIFFNGWQFKTENFKETEWRQSSDILVSGEKAGVVEVYYLQKKPQSQEGPFSKEERQLIDAVAREISAYIQRKDAETALINSEETFRTLVQSISGYLYSITYDKGKSVSIYHSPQCTMITGYTPQDYKEDRDLWIKMVHKDDHDLVINFFDALKRDGKSNPIEHRIIHKEGQTVWVLNRCSLTLDEEGDIKRTDGIVLDITEHKQAEKAVLESERKFRAIFDNAVDGIALAGTDSKRLLLVNEMFCLMTGYSQEEFVNMATLDMHPEEALPHIIEQFERLSRREIEIAENIPVKRKDGSIFYADIKASPYTMGGERCLLGIFRDISERKRAEEAISRALSERNTILETALVGIILIKNRRVVWANSKMEEIFRCEKQELIGEVTEKLYSSFSEYEEIRKRAHPLMIKGETYRTELLMMRKDDSPFWCSIMGRVVEPGEPQKGSIWIIEDITGRKEAEDALRESERSLHKINEVFLTLGIDYGKNINNLTALAGQLLGGCCAIYNRIDKENLFSVGQWNTPYDYNPTSKGDGHICYDVIKQANDRIFIVHDLQNTPFAQTDPNIVQNKIQTYIGHAIRCGQDYIGSLCVLYQNDFIPEDEHKKTMGIIASAIGLEEERIKSEQSLKKAKEEAEEATTLKDKFVSLVAHDLRAPITVIRGYLQLLSQESFDPEVIEDIYSETIGSCDDMTQLINEVLSLSKMTSEGISPECNFIHASELVEKSIYNYTVLAEKKGIELANELPEDMRIYSDERLMLEAVVNIISNAVKFCHEGDKIRIYKPDGEATTIAVADTGIGIKPDRMDSLFRYETKTSTRGTSGEMGTGFGLPLSRDILKAHGGELTVQSLDGEGSTFFLRLPFVKPQVLIVDDEQIVIDSIKRYLKTIDTDILEALDGESAINALEKGHPHLILLDIYLPGINGLEILERLKGDPKTRNIPIIIITGAPDMKVHEKAFQLGADDLIYKPFKRDDLIPRVKRFVG